MQWSELFRWNYNQGEMKKQADRERVFGKRLILHCKDMLSWVLVTLFNCRVGSFCDILLAFSASPHHIKLTYPRINCLNTHFLSSQLPTTLFWFPPKTGLRCAARRTVRELAGRRAEREGTGCSRQLSWLFHCLKNVIIVLGFYKHGAQCAAHSASQHRMILWLHARWLKRRQS